MSDVPGDDIGSIKPANNSCRYCSKRFTVKNSCVRHEKSCFLNNSKQQCDFLCDYCGSSFARKDNLISHQKKCNGSTKISKAPCLVEDCSFKFYHRSALINHLKSNHKDFLVKDPITKTFSNLEEFKKWKESEEESTFSFFSKKFGVPESSKFHYYYCQHDGSAKNLSERKTIRRASKGRIKVGRFCIAKMKVWEQEDLKVRVEYFPTHSHPCSPQDYVHHPLSESVSEFINEQISEEVSPSKILQNISRTFMHKDGNDLTNLKLNVITRKRITERTRRYRMGLKLNQDDAKAVNLVTHQMSGENSLLICKPHGGIVVFEPSDIVNVTEDNSINPAIQFVPEKMDESSSLMKGIKDELAAMKKENEQLRRANATLSREVTSLKDRVQTLEKYSRNNNEVSRIPETPREDVISPMRDISGD